MWHGSRWAGHGVLCVLLLGGCGREMDIREVHPVLFPFYAASCYGKPLAEKVKNKCNLTKEERAALDQSREEANRQQLAVVAQEYAQADAQFPEQKAREVTRVNRWLNEVLQRLDSDPRTRLDRSGPSVAFDLAQRAIREEYEKCVARVSLGEKSGGAACEQVMRWQLDASTNWWQIKLAR